MRDKAHDTRGGPVIEIAKIIAKSRLF